MWISRKRLEELEKRIADLEDKVQDQQTVKALYPYVVELRLPDGLTRSPTYWELARMRV